MREAQEKLSDGEKKELERGCIKQQDSEESLKMKVELEEKTRLASEYLSQLQYLRADFENLKKFAAREKAEYIKSANEELVKKLLPVLDSFESALKIKEVEGSQAIREGIEKMNHQLSELLEREGLKPIPAIGAVFDPLKHEAIAQGEKSDCEEERILEEYQKGYTFNSKVIRTSKVKVSKR